MELNGTVVDIQTRYGQNKMAVQYGEGIWEREWVANNTNRKIGDSVTIQTLQTASGMWWIEKRN